MDKESDFDNLTTAAMICVGNELLTGEQKEENLSSLGKFLFEKGIILKETRIVQDEENDIIETIKVLKRRYDYLFISGGMGPTHDDITNKCVAFALNVQTEFREDYAKTLENKIKRQLEEDERKMLTIPSTAKLIDEEDPSKLCYCVENSIYVMAGVPEIFEKCIKELNNHIDKESKIYRKIINLSVPEYKISSKVSKIAQKEESLWIGIYTTYKTEGEKTKIIIRGIDEKKVLKIYEMFNKMFIKYQEK